jgi:hypothetical protein
MAITFNGQAELPPGYSARRNADGSVTLHHGTLFSGLKPNHLPAHTVEIDGIRIAVPSHTWNGEWTYKRPMSIQRSPADLVAANRMFPFGSLGSGIATPFNPASVIQIAIMDISSVTPYMPTTGERGDIGLITDAIAWFLLTGDPSPMLNFAQACGTFPVHFRDERTGKPVDLIQYPKANCYDDASQGQPWFDRYPRDSSNNYIVPVAGGNRVVPQPAHYPELSYVAHMATLGMGFLEDLQYSANFMLLSDAGKSTDTKAILSSELRGIAWGLRNLFMAHIATKDAEARGPLPSFLLPSSYFKTLLDNALAYYSPIMKNPDAQVFHAFGDLGKFGLQQMSYMLNCLAFGVLTEHDDWEEFYLWCLKQAVALTNGTSGWPVGFGTPVWLCQYKNNDPANPRFKTWGEAFDDIYTTTEGETVNPALTGNAAAYAKLKADPYNGGFAFQDVTRTAQTRGNLITAKYLHQQSICDVYSVYPELDTCIANAERMVRNGGFIEARQSFVAVAPNINPQPATGVTLMPSSAALKIGETHQLNLTVTPADADRTGLIYRAVPDGVVTLTPNDTGVSVTRVKAGNAQIFADLNGHEAEADATYTPPLAESLVLEWA